MKTVKLKIENFKVGFTPSLENGIAQKRGQKPMPFFSAGFTLVELLIVIAIIGVLSSIVITSLSESRGKANDSKIKQQLRNFRSAAEIYYNNQSPNSYGATNVVCTGGTAPNMFADNAATNGYLASHLVFAGINPAPTVVCGSSPSAYAVKVTLQGGGYYCVDSTNKLVSGIGVPTSGTSCP